MPAHIVPTTLQTYRQAAMVLGKAFEAEPVSAVIYRSFSPEKRVRALTVDFTAELAACLRKGCPIHVEEDDRVLAAAIIYPPGAYPLPWLDDTRFLIKSVLRNGWYDLRSWIKWVNETGKFHPTAAHYYLEYIGVDSACQGIGMGGLIMEHLAAKADEAGVGCYLENSDPRNLPFYQRAGYKVLDKKEIIGLPAWLMWRDPVIPL